jgi:hypothetical protein
VGRCGENSSVTGQKNLGLGAVVSTWNTVFQLVRQIFGFAEDELASQGGLCSMELPTTMKHFTFSVLQVNVDLIFSMLKWSFEQGLRRINGRTLVTSTVDSERSSVWVIRKTLRCQGILKNDSANK